MPISRARLTRFNELYNVIDDRRAKDENCIVEKKCVKFVGFKV